MSSSNAISATLGAAPSVSAPRLIPQQLRLRQWVLAGLVVITGWVGWWAYQSYAQVVQTIGKDSVPSVVAAESIRTTLAEAHTDVLNIFLGSENEIGPSFTAYQKAMAKVNAALVDASQNITYGDAERGPILTVLRGLGDYQRLVGRALESKGDGEALIQADTLMERSILPATVALDKTNFDHVLSAYQSDLARASWRERFFFALAVVTGLLLVQTQVWLSRLFRRTLNLPLVAGFAVFVVAAYAFSHTAGSVVDNLKVAKEDAFDSVHALSQAQALAFAANAEESMYLLKHGRPDQESETTQFNATANQILDASLTAQTLPTQPAVLKGRGLLGDELANITFPGEAQAAQQTTASWLQYLQIDHQIRSLETSGQHAQAVALCLGTAPGQSDAVFDAFGKALQQTLGINQSYFDASIAAAFSDVRSLWMWLIALVMVPLLGAFVGLQQRLVEFRA